MATIAESLAEWAHGYVPDADDLALAQRSLLDTVAVTLAAREHPVRTIAAELPDTARWAAVGLASTVCSVVMTGMLRRESSSRM